MMLTFTEHHLLDIVLSPLYKLFHRLVIGINGVSVSMSQTGNLGLRGIIFPRSTSLQVREPEAAAPAVWLQSCAFLLDVPSLIFLLPPSKLAPSNQTAAYGGGSKGQFWEGFLKLHGDPHSQP